VSLKVTTIMLGVEDMARSKKFYGEGLGCAIDQDHPGFVSFNLGDGSSSLALYEREAAAAARWGGYFGYFSDPDGYLWKVASAS
jgi:catechol 2,3-dioxygenase-like lactoylglutathione lyase family enzyme